MKPLPNTIVLKPRFQIDLNKPIPEILLAFKNVETKKFIVNQVDEHVFIKLPKEDLHLWSPQLHLELDEFNNKLHGTFGPNPTLWTFFMFLHFIIATLFIIISIWAYSSASLNKSYGLQIGIMVFLVITWIGLYIFARVGKTKGRAQTHQLHLFMKETLSSVT